MAGNDSYTVFLTNCDGTAGGDSFTDSSVGGSTHTITANGAAQIDSSGKFLQGVDLSNTADYLQVSSSTDFAFGTGVFCIDFWINKSTSADYARVFENASYGSSSGYICVMRSTGYIIFRIGSLELTSDASIDDSTYHHIAIIKRGNIVYMFVDGSLQTSTIDISGYDLTTETLTISKSDRALEGVLDEIRIKKGDNGVDNAADPLYISSGTLADGFIPPTEAYSASAYETFNGETTILDSVSAAETFNSETTILNGLEAETFNGETTTLVRQASPTRFYSETTILNRQDSPVTFNGETTILVRADAVQFVGNTTILRREGEQSYYFDLRDDTDTQVNSAVGYPTQTVFTDLFTGLSDGTYTLYARSVQKYKNLENVLNETKSKFRLTSGIIDPLLPNLPSSIDADLIADAEVTVSFYYDDTSEEIAPTEFLIYADASLEDTITYNGSGAYSTTIGPLAEVSTIIGVLAQSGTDQTELVTIDPVTPDSTPPTTVPITFEVI